MKIPVKLGREPIIDVIFEVRFKSEPGAGGVLPGVMFSKLQGVQNIEPLPAAQLPEQLRAMEPELRYAALNRLHWGKFLVLVGQSSVAVACKLPYPGWKEFRPAILEVVKQLVGAPLVGDVERCSLKYINLFEVKNHAEVFETFSVGVQVGDRQIKSNNTNLRVEIPDGDLLHAVTMVSEAKITLQGSPTPRAGAVLDVDTLAMEVSKPMAEFAAGAPDLLDRLHRANHEVFFGCLTEPALKKLEPVYE